MKGILYYFYCCQPTNGNETGFSETQFLIILRKCGVFQNLEVTFFNNMKIMA